MIASPQIFSLVTNAIFVKVLLTFPKAVVENSANAAWIQIGYNIAVALLFYLFVMRIYNRKKNFIELAEIVGGKPLKAVTGIAVTAVLLFNSVPALRIFPETVKTVLLKETNTEIIVLVMAAAIIIGTHYGINAIALIHRMFLPIAAVVIALFLLFLIPFYKFEYIMPIFGNGAKNIFANGLSSLSLFSDLIILNLLIPFCNNLESAKKCGRNAIITAGLGALSVTLVYCLTFTYPPSGDFIIPMYQMARLVHLSSFFSRFEASFEFVWSIMILLYGALYLYMICYSVQITLGLKYLKPLILPVAVIIFMLALIPDSMMNMLEFEVVVMKYSFIPVFALFLIFGLVCKGLKK